MKRRLHAFAVALATTCAATLPVPSGAADAPKAPHVHEQVRVALEAGAAFYSAWPSGKTVHAGTGYIQPYGAVDYWCGSGYAEAAAYPMGQAVTPWTLTNADDAHPLFCVYRTPGGDIYAYDILVGTIERVSGPKPERRDALVNYVVGGTGRFAGATGVWVGTAAGRGDLTKSNSGLQWPMSIIKQMEGFVRRPAPQAAPSG